MLGERFLSLNLGIPFVFILDGKMVTFLLKLSILIFMFSCLHRFGNALLFVTGYEV